MLFREFIEKLAEKALSSRLEDLENTNDSLRSDLRDAYDFINGDESLFYQVVARARSYEISNDLARLVMLGDPAEYNPNWHGLKGISSANKHDVP